MTDGEAADRPTLLRWVRLASFALTAAGALFAAWTWLYWTSVGGNPADLRTYLETPVSDPYGGWVLGASDAYQYSPAFLQLIQPLTWIPFETAAALWRAAALIVVVALAGPLTIPVLLWGPVASEINAGNVNLFVAGAIAAGLRWSGAWSLVLHTKITPGIGLLWFVIRGEWRKVGIALAVTAAVTAISFVLAPTQWVDWVSLVVGNALSGSTVTTFPYWIPLGVRLPVAAIIVGIAGLRGWWWPVPIAATIAAPVLYFPTQAIAIGALPEVRRLVGERLARTLGDSATRPTAPRQPRPEGDHVPPEVVR